MACDKVSWHIKEFKKEKNKLEKKFNGRIRTLDVYYITFMMMHSYIVLMYKMCRVRHQESATMNVRTPL